jgi:hypothetical protein
MTQQVLAPSTRNPRLPAGCKAVDIFSGGHVAVLPRSAIGTRPISLESAPFTHAALSRRAP